VVIAKPEIRSFKIDESHDFILLGCDGIFDKLNDEDSVSCVWKTVRQQANPDIHETLGLGVECIMKNALHRRSLDNVTVVIIAFEGFKRTIEEMRTPSSRTPSSLEKHGGVTKSLRQKVGP
jgi:protein phosphatase PTC2/3